MEQRNFRLLFDIDEIWDEWGNTVYDLKATDIVTGRQVFPLPGDPKRCDSLDTMMDVVRDLAGDFVADGGLNFARRF